MSYKGKFITLYGVNNLGKSTQMQKLKEKFHERSIGCLFVKYGIYNLAPSGPELDAYLRKGNLENLSPREFQLIHVINRTHYEPRISAQLVSGTHVVAEDYTGTGIAWGMGAGVNKEFLLRMNSRLRKEDLAILLDGERFTESIEAGHAHEEQSELIKKVRQIHLDLAEEFGWHVVNANQPEEKVHADIWKLIEPIL
jgi:thymidylate kinase